MGLVVASCGHASFRLRPLRPAGRPRHGVRRVAGPRPVSVGSARPTTWRALRPASCRCPSRATCWRPPRCVLPRATCGRPPAWSASALTLGALAGLGTLVARALPTRRVLERALVAYGPAEDRPGGPGPLSAAALRRTRPVAAALLVPFVRRRRDVQRIADLAYGGAGRFQRLDLYRHRSGPNRRAGVCLLPRRPLPLGFEEPRGTAAALPAGRKRLDRRSAPTTGSLRPRRSPTPTWTPSWSWPGSVSTSRRSAATRARS